MTTINLTHSNAYIERAIITGMIVSDRVLRVVGLIYKPQYMVTDYAREVAKWCLIYQERYSKAPRADIQVMFDSYRRNGLDPERADLIAQFLASISHEYERQGQYNEQLVIDEATNYFKERALRILSQDLEDHLKAGNINQALALVAGFNAVDSAMSTGVDLLTDIDGLREAFDEQQSLLTIGGDFGKLVGPLERDWLVMVVGKYKSTKSWMCQYIALQALFARLNVAWFDFELGEKRLRRRIAQSLCAMPIRQRDRHDILVPVYDCALNQRNECLQEIRLNRVRLLDKHNRKPSFYNAPRGYKPCRACEEGPYDTWFTTRQVKSLDWRTAWQKVQSIAAAVMGARFRLQSWPKFSAGVEDVQATLQIWRYIEGFTPDVIVIDQPDIMKLSRRGGDYRHAVDELWKRLGSIAQEMHCLLIAPSQAGGKTAQERKRLLDSDVAEDSRKLGHVDYSIKIDQDDEDEQARRVWISRGVARDDSTGDKVCLVLQCLELGQPVLSSKLVKAAW